YWQIGGLVTSICLPVLIWGLVTRQSASANGLIVQTSAAPISASGQIAFILGHPWQVIHVLINTPVSYGYDFASGIVGTLGMSLVYPPFILTMIVLVSLVFVLRQADDLRSLPLRNHSLWKLGLLGLPLLGVITLFIGLYITFTPVGWGVVRGIQGRYFIPFIPFLLWGTFYSKRQIPKITKNSYLPIIIVVMCASPLVMVTVYTLTIRSVF
ncbi:MAG TPA: DUF2142 domain-containing protein, partial [Patescibacteria group bacterium]|nr:DUF2142 domain-containing protein [Patescibacteria group bacterium]